MEPSVKLEHITPNAEFLIENAVRVCYNSYNNCDGSIECARAMIHKIIKWVHLDTLEHASATFKISCSRAAMAQFTRSRLASFGVESQRYVEYDKFDKNLFLDVPHYDSGHHLYEQIIEMSHQAYRSLIETHGWKKEDARLVLPEAWATNFYVTMNFRAWRHFIELRADKASQWEIRSLARQILKILTEDSPSCFEDLHEKYI